MHFVSVSLTITTESTILDIRSRDIFFTPGGLRDAAIVIGAEGPEPINAFMTNVQSAGNVKFEFIRAHAIGEMRKIV
jgi:hypothetical protein